MLEAFFGFLLEMVVEIVLQALIELGFVSMAQPFKPAREVNPILAGIGLLFLGGFAALLFSLVLHDRLLPELAFPGLSLLLAPILVGTVMEWFGRWRRSTLAPTTALATFGGGALFAFAFALVRIGFLAL